MNLDQRISVVLEAMFRLIRARAESAPVEEDSFLRNQLVTLLQVELGAEQLTLGKAIGLLEVGKVDAAHRLLRARAKELR